MEDEPVGRLHWIGVAAAGIAAIGAAVPLFAGLVSGTAQLVLLFVVCLLVALVAVLLPRQIRTRLAPFLAVFVAAAGLIPVFLPDDDETSPSARTEVPSQEGEPQGTLTLSGVGAVQQGMKMEEVREHFGSPDRVEDSGFPGDAPLQRAWIWDLPDGQLAVWFEIDTGEMLGYSTNSRRLPTQWGIRVRDSFTSIREILGSSLEPLTLGSEPSDAENGYWTFGDTDTPTEQMTFQISDGVIGSILGGYSLVGE